MASIQLSDGRTVPIVKPHIGDQMDLERQMKANNPKYGPADFREDLKLSGFQTAFGIFASLNRAGVKATIQEVLEMDLAGLAEVITLDPGDNPDAEPESEGEETTDPRSAQTGDADETPEPGPSLIG